MLSQWYRYSLPFGNLLVFVVSFTNFIIVEKVKKGFVQDVGQSKLDKIADILLLMSFETNRALSNRR